MDALTEIPTVLKVIADFGLVGVVLVMWWLDAKSIRKVLEQYKSDMLEMRKMYENNAHLVEKYEALAKDLREIIVMNTQAITMLIEEVKGNQFCPMVRLEKRSVGKVEP